MCRKHYKRWYKFGDPNFTKKVYRQGSTCSVESCENEPAAKGLCTNHYALKRRNGEPVVKKVYVGSYIKDGYKYVHVDKRRYEPEHRVIVERKLGRKLNSEEQVHHIDGDPLNNDPNNLQVLSRSEHMKIHRPDLPSQYWPRRSS